MLSHLRPSPEFVEDVRQQLMEQLFVADVESMRRIFQYTGRGPLKNWIRAKALGIAIDMKRKSRRHVVTEGARFSEVESLIDNAELGLIRNRYRPEFRKALEAAILSISPRDRNVLRLYYLSGLTLEQVAAAYKVHRITVARWLGSCRQGILNELHRNLAHRLQVSQSQLNSLLQVIRSQLDVTLKRVLATSPGARLSAERV